MASLYTHIDSNNRKTWLLMSMFFVIIILVGWAISYAMNDQSILYFAVIISITSSFISYWWSDKIVLAMSSAKPLTHDNNTEIYHLVENLCITAGLPLPKIYIIDDTAPNAFATGRNPEHAVICLTTGIIQKLEKSELEGVIAHELSHIGNRDILISTITTVMVGVIVLLADWFRRWSLFSDRRRSGNREGAQIEFVMTLVAIILSILAPIFASLLQMAVCRKREFLADADGAMLTRYPEGLASALEKISRDQEPLEAANRATAHLYIASPFKEDAGRKIGFWTRAFMTHPPIEERIAALRGLEIK